MHASEWQARRDAAKKALPKAEHIYIRLSPAVSALIQLPGELYSAAPAVAADARASLSFMLEGLNGKPVPFEGLTTEELTGFTRVRRAVDQWLAGERDELPHTLEDCPHMNLQEATITVAGTELTSAQAMAVRVAVSNFRLQLTDPKLMRDLGRIGTLYDQRLAEVERLMVHEILEKEGRL